MQPARAMASAKKEERREDRKFVALGPETVQLVAETVGVPNLQPTVAAALSEDASYRVREMAHVSSIGPQYPLKDQGIQRSVKPSCGLPVKMCFSC